VAVTLFASLVQDYLIAHGQLAEADAGRMIALMSDAEAIVDAAAELFLRPR